MRTTNWYHVLFATLIGQYSVAQIPQTMSYQGRLTDAGGNPVANGNYSLTFKLYDTTAAGSELWTETQASVAVSGGIFSVSLGSVTPFGLPFDRRYYLGISVQGGAELSPRTALTSSPYSIRSLGVSGGNNIFPPSGNVGIGTTSPFMRFQVDDGNIRINGPGDGKQRLFLGPVGGVNDGYTGVYNENAVGLKLAVFKSAGAGGFGANSIDALTIRETSGNVGIGLTNPGAKFTLPYNGYLGWDANNNGDGIVVHSIGKSVTGATPLEFRNSSNPGPLGKQFSFIGVDELLTILYNGNVGIGTTSPGQKLDVAGTAQMTGFRLSSGPASGYVLTSDSSGFGSWQAAAGGGIGGSGTVNYLSKFTGSTSLGNSVLYESGGNVGIGTSNPGDLSTKIKLQVEGGISLGDRPNGINSHLVSQGPNLVFNKADSGGSFYFRKNSVAGDPDVYTDLAVIDNLGNLGIGTTAPGDRLSIYGGGMALVKSGGGHQVHLRDDASGLDWVLRHNGGSFQIQDEAGDQSGAPSNIIATFTNAGALGIGTTSPGTKLQTLTTTTNDGISIVGNPTAGNTVQSTIYANMVSGSYNGIVQSGDMGLIYTGTTIGNAKGFVIAPWMSGTSGLRIDGSGNVGIGTTSPAQKLDVAGTVQVTGFKLPTAAANGYVLTSDSAGIGTWKAAAGGGIGGSGTVNYMPKFTGATTVGNSAIYESAGNVGIGTTSPAQKLDVAGSVRASNNYLYASNQTRYLSVSHSAFEIAATNTSVHPHRSFTGSAPYILRTQGGTLGTICYFAAPVALPNDATITELSAHFYDADATYNASVTFVRQTINGPSNSSLVSVATSTSAGQVTLSSTTVTNPVVDNSTYAYLLVFQTVENNPTNLGLYNARIKYTVSQTD